MKILRIIRGMLGMFFVTIAAAVANNINISNIGLVGQDAVNHFFIVQFDISWNNSWRTSSAPLNSDAAWIFVKFRESGGEWLHATINLTEHTAPAGSTITPATDGTGAFIYRDADGIGTFSKTGVQLCWNYGANGVADNATVDINVFAIEMVYVPTGAFVVGSGGTETSAFYKYPTTTNTYSINSEDAISIGIENDNLFYAASLYGGDQTGNLSYDFPKGYAAFYCMKYEISQQGYVDFLNSLTQTQATARKYDMTGSDYRYAITGNVVGLYTTENPYVACNYLSWADVAAYLDWSGLRPMTELEYEKACRGTGPAVVNEYAWATTGIAANAYTLNNSRTISEGIATNYNTLVGNAAYGITTQSGPVRSGIFAGASGNTGRVTSGATYYGIMEMSGNLSERNVSVANDRGRLFAGTHGNGTLNVTGDANADTWPGANAVGAGFRGGDWLNSAADLSVSNRANAALIVSGRVEYYGGRGVRVARFDNLTNDAPMIFINGGNFHMGQPDANIAGIGYSDDEQPVHSVSVSSFYMDKYEITYEKWTEVRKWALAHGYVSTDIAIGRNGSSPIGLNNPVTEVSWYDVIKWCNARSEKDGLTPVYYTRSVQDTVYRTADIDLTINAVKSTANGYRLPTEAEWEFAAQGGMNAQFPTPYIYSGSNSIDIVAWYYTNSEFTTHPVGGKAANELGIYDMSGNVWEWCWDWYDTYSSSLQTDPMGPSDTQTYRVSRGGSFDYTDHGCRTPNRYNIHPTERYDYLGFRCAKH